MSSHEKPGLRPSPSPRCSVIACLLAVLVVISGNAAAVDFAKDIEPIFHEHCIDCHGPDEQNSQFRLDRLAVLLAGGNSGEPAVVPGDPGASYLLRLVKHDEPGWEMPPDGELSPDEIESIEQWIRGGASTPTRYGPAKEKVELNHWSFQPIRRPAPDVRNSDGIDTLIRRKLAENGLQPSPIAERRVLIRRLYLVMAGLPPTPEQMDAFVRDDRHDAWQRLVETVLASPHYGQRWASHWLDLVRFGETNGFETNRERPNAWHYRDWVIDSLNRDKPYDDFIRQQIAGDALGADIGTGFLVAGPHDIVKGQDPKLGLVQRMNELDDMINTTGTAFLGLTTGCARCHNHKFDPISQRDYYAMQAVFAGVRHGERSLPPTKERAQQLAETDAEIAELTDKLQPYVARDTTAAIAIDESDAQPVFQPAGTAAKQGRNEADFGGKHYTWWKARPGEETVVYQPHASGLHRVWLSWGSGYATHCSDARYVLRSATGDREICSVNQQRLAGGSGEVDGVARWSGFYDAGVHEFAPDDRLVLIAGDSGSALTADVVVLQPEPETEGKRPPLPPTRRAAVNSVRNEERFAPRLARFVRFVIEQTSGSQACVDELEIYAGDQNVALASSGAKASSSGDFQHPLHKLQHINDGRYGNARSWIVDSVAGGWVQIELAEPTEIDRIVWGRDREQTYSDRLTTAYHIDVANEPGNWARVASSADRLPHGEPQPEDAQYRFDNVSSAEAQRAKGWLNRLKLARQRRDTLETSPQVYAGTFSQPGQTYRLYRGEPDARREPVGPDTIEVFGSLKLDQDAPEQSRRLALADWIASADNPLTPRVIVNRLWQFHFGTGIVDTPSDFGHNGTRPSHPELLDYLAGELIDHDWSLKHIHRLILNSQTWRQSNRPREDAWTIDADCRLLWRFPPRRCDAESIRDSILAVSGSLRHDAAGGPGFSGFAVQLENVRHYHPKQQFGPEDWRRMIYMTKVRQERDQVFGVFDCPDASMVVAQRSRSTTPLQALNLLNSRFVMQQAERMAARLENEAESPSAQITRAWHLCFGRPPTDEELSDSTAFIAQEGLTQFARALLNANEFVLIP
ncbi:PSD1 and planctomycete cytochrome C domain-containing protein [Stieleria sp. ICT_E10.1]|uniref:PSD1 and planctomycete cytochrome C domain-containing protein n=1 Tax=Stieleria sedimenti TaxID=2976331 RepID=UPI00217F9063|nr:PSD1 and planctomycete cytochrome C domain-containing protein [Stieleria sedimenti]MCS7468585.1 PSD1 and planctomycete cytochrome C domain-containing protein [Stieleria sedimenti]